MMMDGSRVEDCRSERRRLKHRAVAKPSHDAKGVAARAGKRSIESIYSPSVTVFITGGSVTAVSGNERPKRAVRAMRRASWVSRATLPLLNACFPRALPSSHTNTGNQNAGERLVAGRLLITCVFESLAALRQEHSTERHSDHHERATHVPKTLAASRARRASPAHFPRPL